MERGHGNCIRLIFVEVMVILLSWHDTKLSAIQIHDLWYLGHSEHVLLTRQFPCAENQVVLGIHA